MQYRRSRREGGTYFFTVVTYNRQQLFDTPEMVELLRESFRTVKQRHPFTIDAIVVLPDHLHCLWTLPKGDANFSTRWRLIKSEFSRHCPEKYKQPCSLARYKKQEQAIWQRRFWEHLIRDENDFVCHVEYIHHNPAKHGLVQNPYDWPYSSIHLFRRP
ncbi:transposase [Leptolyngbyaceae cyanobacterium CCMR0082]|uniref:Transposase n=1 Tax=Adonisia turfae CCMR0082 TaxID=2304604 RepID=A0A6M0S4X5_9CYAN|nr:transposase [Adonisia turfae]NEZ63435.1 transposase [Adonisia turfae CCMR0082]